MACASRFTGFCSLTFGVVSNHYPPFTSPPLSIGKIYICIGPPVQGGAILLSSGDSWEAPGATLITRNSTFVGNVAGLDNGGAINLGEYTVARFEDSGNKFTNNKCNINGGVAAASTNTNVTVEGGLFEGNDAKEVRGKTLVQCSSREMTLPKNEVFFAFFVPI